MHSTDLPSLLGWKYCSSRSTSCPSCNSTASCSLPAAVLSADSAGPTGRAAAPACSTLPLLSTCRHPSSLLLGPCLMLMRRHDLYTSRSIEGCSCGLSETLSDRGLPCLSPAHMEPSEAPQMQLCRPWCSISMWGI